VNVRTTNKLVEIYDKSGQEGVYEWVKEKHPEWEWDWCKPCECLCCMLYTKGA
jgi:hypothetical protein